MNNISTFLKDEAAVVTAIEHGLIAAHFSSHRCGCERIGLEGARRKFSAINSSLT